jgi:hypothetical protein
MYILHVHERITVPIQTVARKELLKVVFYAQVVGSNPAHGEVYSIHRCMIKFVSDLTPVSSTNKIDHHKIAEILLKV